MHSKIKEFQKRASVLPYSDISAERNKMSTDDRIVKGYLTAWGVKDDWGTVMVKGCCAKSLQDRGVNSNSNYKITFLDQHQQKCPIGKFLVLEEDDYGLYFEAEVDDIELGNDRLKQLRSGTLNNFSIGFDYVWDMVEYDDKNDALLLKEIKLFEGSVVTIPSNMGTYAIRSADTENERMELMNETEECLKGLPAQTQFNIKQLILRHTSLAKSEPFKETLEQHKPTQTGIDYNYLLQNLNK